MFLSKDLFVFIFAGNPYLPSTVFGWQFQNRIWMWSSNTWRLKSTWSTWNTKHSKCCIWNGGYNLKLCQWADDCHQRCRSLSWFRNFTPIWIAYHLSHPARSCKSDGLTTDNCGGFSKWLTPRIKPRTRMYPKVFNQLWVRSFIVIHLKQKQCVEGRNIGPRAMGYNRE